MRFITVRIKDIALVLRSLSDRYITDLPDKAIDLIDETASKLHIEIDSLPTDRYFVKDSTPDRRLKPLKKRRTIF